MSTFTISQIADALTVTKRTAERRADRESWPYTEVKVQGGPRRQYSPENLPRDVREAILVHVARNLQISGVQHENTPLNAGTAAVSQTSAPTLHTLRTGAGNQSVIPESTRATVPAQAPVGNRGIVLQRGSGLTSQADLTDPQKLKENARLGVIAAVRRLQADARCSQEAAMVTLLTRGRAGELEPLTLRMLQLARDERGAKGDGSGLPTVRSLKRWMKDAQPKAKRPRKIPAWGATFLAYYQQPQKPSVESAYRQACAENAFGAEVPSIHQVQRFKAMLGEVTCQMGRMGERELKNIQPFVRRDFSHLEPNDIWTGDGHTFDAEVQHPFHGRPFRPEITTFIDVATRRAVAWSVGLAESSQAVADALRWGVEKNGIPALIYVDNGSGYRNAFMADEALGLVGRLGATMVHSLPYNSQARGVIERSHQTLWVQGAKLLPSYMGAAMDREARLAQFKLTRKALKHGGTMPLIPWDLFIEYCQKIINEYNARAHRSLKGLSPDLCLANFSAKGWEPVLLQAGEIDTLFRPRIERTTARGELNVLTNIYFSPLLREFTGDKVHVSYDIHDPSKVWVYAPDGRFICTAEVNGNSKHYYPVPVIDQAREKRAKGRLGKVESKREEILAELNGTPALAADIAERVVIGGRVINPKEAIAARQAVTAASAVTDIPADMPRIQPAPPAPARKARSDMTSDEIYAEWLEVGRALQAEESVSEQDRNFYRRWPESSQGKVWFKRHANGV